MAPALGSCKLVRRRPTGAAATALLLLLLIVVAPFEARAARKEKKGAKITLQAKWQGTPLVHEAAEFLADEDPALFWQFVEAWQRDAPAVGDAPTPHQCWAGIHAAAAAHLSPNMARLFAVSLAARQYSPRLEMFRQLAQESHAGGGADGACCWALLGGRAYTAAAELEAALAQALEVRAAQLLESGGEGVEGGAGTVYPFDHVYAPPASLAPALNLTSPAALSVELYAPLGSRCGGQLHAVLAAAAARTDAAAAAAGGALGIVPRVAYAWRPLLPAGGCAAADGLHPCTALGSEGRLVIPGYGVELALKNMEYNAQDDSKKADSKAAGEEAGDEEAEGEAEGEEGEEEEDDGVLQIKLKNLGLQAAQRIVNAATNASVAADPLAALQEVAQDFPRLARQLSQMKYGKSLRVAVEGLQRYIPPGASFLLLNGLLHDARDLSLHNLLDTLRGEVRLHDALSALGLPPGEVREAVLARGGAAGADEAPRLRLAGDGIAWINDLERDQQYARWPRELQSLLMPVYPGRLPKIRRNVLNAIYAFDPAAPAALEIGALLGQLEGQSWPLRMGVVPVVAERVARARGGAGPRPDEPPSLSERMGRLLALLHTTLGGRAVTHVLYAARLHLPAGAEDQADYSERLWAAAKQAAEEQWAALQEQAAAEVEGSAAEAIALAEAPGDCASAEVSALLDAAAELAGSTGLAGPARAGVLVFNGVVSTNDGGGGWQGVTLGAVQAALQQVQEDVYMQRLADDSTDLHEDILRLHGSIPRYNPRILPLDAAAGYVRISGETDEYPARQLSLTGPLLGISAVGVPPAAGGAFLKYFGLEASMAAAAASDDDDQQGAAPLAAVTHWVVADARSRRGLRLVASALQHRSAAGRVAVLANTGAAAPAPGSGPADVLLPIESVVVAVCTGLLPASPIDFVEQLDEVLRQPQPPAALTLAQLDEAMGYEGRLPRLLADLDPVLGAAAASQARLVRAGLRLGPGANAVVSNGRLLELPGGEGEGEGEGGAAPELEPHDFELLELFAQRNQFSGRALELVRGAVQGGAALPGADPSAVVAAVSSALAAAKPEEVDARSGRVSELISARATQKNHVHLAAPGDGGASPLLVQAVLNPLSQGAQRLAPLLSFLRSVLGAEVDLLLNPQRDHEGLPLKTFYRYVLPALDGEGLPQPAAASFAGLPPDKVLTLGMDEPEPWLVEPVRAEHDLDNLRLEEVGGGRGAMEATFELEALMLTGMCLDLASLAARMRDQIHPRGVQLQLAPRSAPEDAPPLVDTLVMSNLGYFQLKSRPGLWKLKLAPGRSRDLYSVASSTGASSSGQRAEAAVAGADSHQVPVAMSSFSGKHMHLFLRKHADRLREDVLQSDEGEEGQGGGSLWSKVSSWTAGSGVAAPAVEGEERETIHVFTVASGHMYERLQKIMVLSAIKRTPARIKFWFIKNYMSPQMKAFVPLMAEKYGFDYEFVTYKWPSWLHKQTEKQRIIWAYKILFLDVLFPLGLKKVIFCDSDQVVRADLRELWHMDLQGAPYGYTPFCDNNQDMEGFRFWKTGFWKDHLQGRPYHISALYVVDLERFRQMAAGDRLRVIYDGLSKDPNSLANLDQDLPNYAQHGVPIFSLPREWLWCETWCGSETRPQAKTIDLCNNPLTKEPKLQSARRIIAEWPHLDREAQEFTAAAERVQRGELSREALLADQSLFHVRLAPMVEGSTWTSEGGDANWPADPGAGGAAEGHDASEL